MTSPVPWPKERSSAPGCASAVPSASTNDATTAQITAAVGAAASPFPLSVDRRPGPRGPDRRCQPGCSPQRRNFCRFTGVLLAAMRHVRTITICVAACAAGALAAGATGAGASTPVAKLRGFSCQRSVNPVGRGVAVSAVMRPLKGRAGWRCASSCSLRTKAKPSWTSGVGRRPRFVADAAQPDARPATGRRLDRQQVGQRAARRAGGVPLPGDVPVDRDAGPDARARRFATSATCIQPELRPDLLVQSIDVQPISGHPKLNLYVATIANAGRRRRGGFRVQFNPGNGDAVEVPWRSSSSRRTPRRR